MAHPITIPVYSPHNSPRLQYVLRWLFALQPNTDFRLIYSADEAVTLPFVIAYGATLPNALCIPDAGLLWEKKVKEHKIPTGMWNGMPTIYAIDDNNYTLPFDLFSAVFFMLSRYEEYYSYTPDKHGRYPATASIAYKNGWLQRPLVDEWLQAFRNILRTHCNQPVEDPVFIYQPTYDIDIAYSYRYKGSQRTLGALAKDMLTGKLGAVTERTAVLANKQRQDPYDSFEWLQQLHKKYHYKPIYFVLAALKTTEFDKNISPRHPAMRTLIASMAKEGSLGMHPSYYTENNIPVWRDERDALELASCSRSKITQSRQHYIKLHLPNTYTELIHRSMTEDYSMGYGTHLGFRAGTGQPFPWYDLQHEKTAALLVYPFCFMDTTALYEEHMNAPTAFAILRSMKQRLQHTGSTLITVFHNFSLGTASEWPGWREAYEAFVSER